MSWWARRRSVGRRGGVGGGTWLAVRRGSRFGLGVCAVSVAAGSTAFAQYQFQVPTQRCFGAAARDVLAPCVNPRLAFTVVPSPSQALITPSPGCLHAQFLGLLNVCQFGDPAAGAGTNLIALVGDSHAWHWKPAVEVLARGERASGVSITRTSCAFSVSTGSISGPRAALCAQWNELLLRWFSVHPAVSTVFVSAHSAGPARTAGQKASLARMIAGDIAAWRALPATVKHIIVIRDTPLNRFDTLTCVERAQARHQQAGVACALPRRTALTDRTDAPYLAARSLHSPRVRIADLTPFFCDSRLCYPVVGGALVYRDIGHLTDAFSASLGPFLLRAVERILPSPAPKPYAL